MIFCIFVWLQNEPPYQPTSLPPHQLAYDENGVKFICCIFQIIDLFDFNERKNTFIPRWRHAISHFVYETEYGINFFIYCLFMWK